MIPTPSYLTRSPLPALGMTSLVLGVIGLILAFLPILGMPLSALGLILGIVGVIAAFTVPGTYLRWAVAGLLTSALSLGLNVAIYTGPGRQVPDPHHPAPWQLPPDSPLAPPPARQ